MYAQQTRDEREAERETYKTTVAAFLKRRGLFSFSPMGDDDSSSFSWRGCECCGHRLGGDLTDCSGLRESDGEVIEVRACDECVYFVANGIMTDE